MKPASVLARVLLMSCVLGVVCTPPPVKKFYMLNYEPEQLVKRIHTGPYPYILRVKDFDIEQAYKRDQIVYRKSAYELEYYNYKVWAVDPARMITDLVAKHLSTAGLVSRVVRRYDESGRPDYELSGTIEALEEYDSENVWFAHLALRLKCTRTADGRTVYFRRFDRRKKVHHQDVEYVVREMSKLLDVIMSQAVHDLDVTLAGEFGVSTDEEIGQDETGSSEITDEDMP